ncbi:MULTISPECIES: glutathione synthase [Methylotenera]|uniref:glutathione synthase n=1 Tax=Methylotenera TaxID=359407 RepID=UPI00036F292F|nr:MULTISPECIES: glutathione synthase [Methylotenera]
MKLLFILDPLASLKSYKDTSIAIMREAAVRGHELFVCEQHDVFLQNETVHIQVNTFNFTQTENWFELGVKYVALPKEFDAILMRKDPPFDNEYLYSTYLLELAANQGARIINNPTAVRSWNEKLSTAKFPQFTPEFLVTANNDLIRKFLTQHQDIIVKPLDGMGGTGIFRLTESDPNIGVVLEISTLFGTKTVMVQRYLPAILQGDKRIIVINGEPLPFALARIPKLGETRGNLAAGGTGVAQALTARDLEIATTVGKTLKKEGLFLVGLDVIGDYLTEINVTSPTGMVEIAAQTKDLNKPCNPAQIFITELETIR